MRNTHKPLAQCCNSPSLNAGFVLGLCWVRAGFVLQIGCNRTHDIVCRNVPGDPSRKSGRLGQFPIYPSRKVVKPARRSLFLILPSRVADHLAEKRWVLVGWDDGQTNCGFPPYLLQKDPGTAGRTESFWIYPSRGLEFLRRLLQDKTSQTHARSTLVAVRPAHKCHGSCW